MTHIVSHQSTDFSLLFEDLKACNGLHLPFGTTLDQRYQSMYWQHRQFENVSFVVAQNNTPCLGLLLTKDKYQEQNVFSQFGRPAVLLINRYLSPRDLKKPEKVFRKHIDDLIFTDQNAQLVFHDYMENGSINILTDIALSRGVKMENDFYKVINLTPPKDVIRSQVRDSYRSLINWGLKNLNIQIKTANTISEQDIQDFRQLHIKEAGKETRSLETWQIQFQQIIEGEAFLVTGHDGNALITAALFLHSEHYCYYGVSASRRDLFAKPLGHAVLWRAIEYAKDIGCQLFETGSIEYVNNNRSADATKMQNIGLFKRGFGGDIRLRLNGMPSL